MPKNKDEEKESIVAEESEPPTEEALERHIEKRIADAEGWKPKTELGRQVKAGNVASIDAALEMGRRILEPEIVDILVPNLEADLIMLGQAKGKFGGGQRRVFRQTQKKTNEGNKPSFSTIVVIGNKKGYVGVGGGKARETVPAREKAIRRAKLNIMKLPRGCGSWVCGCGQPHSVPFRVTGKTGSVSITLMPAPRGTGLRVQKECQRLFVAAGITDVWSQTMGQTRTTVNLIGACVAAFKKLSSMKVQQQVAETLGMVSK